MHRIHPNFGLKTKIGYEEWWKQLLEGTFSDNEENKISDEKLTKMTNYLLEIYKTTTCWSLCYGALDFLNYLKLQQQFESQAGKNEPHFRMGVISNFDDRLDVLLRNMKINHYFEFVLSSYRAGFEKPDQEIFKEAMKQSGLKDLKPSECLHIGDTPITVSFET
jgi:REG-2-like HAD superfamily hydrolase